ncbi:MAG: PSD1 and planctomycete cytochrome C domain-containing protein [Planctomycetota bacterium]
MMLGHARYPLVCCSLIALLLAPGWLVADEPRGNGKQDLPAAVTDAVEFRPDIDPIVRDHCLSCHGTKQQKGGFRLDQKSAAMRGGDSFSPAIIPRKSAASPLVRMVAGLEEGFEMPAQGDRLTARQISLLRGWIDQGASWPDDAAGDVDPRRQHWAWQPIRRPSVPTKTPTGHEAWGRNPIDAFILAQLSAQNLTPSPAADLPTLARRVLFTLTVLPPSPNEVVSWIDLDATTNIHSTLAYEQLVDRLLASPRYGERWARHWLDVVRFAESDGFETNQPRPNAWPYRDYVIRSFNEDKPYDRFVFEQLAGDRVGRDEAMGFLVGGPFDRVKSPDIVLTLTQRADELHDMIGTTGSAFLGVTVGCARCHSHKFDPISQTDYYAMRAVFAGVQHGERQLKPADYEQRMAENARLQAQIERLDTLLAPFAPAAYPQQTILLDDRGDSRGPEAVGVTQVVPRIGVQTHQVGTGRGQASDPGDALHLPNLGRDYSYWNNAAGRDLFTWNPRAEGSYRIWLSWGCGFNTHSPDATYLLDRDGNLETREDQTELAVVDQRQFADGSDSVSQQPLWSGFRDAGVHRLQPTSRIVLRGGKTAAYVSADLICLQAEETKTASNQPRLRSTVVRRANVERFAPVAARWVRMTIQEATAAEPCIDELEIFSAGANPRNVALATAGTKVSASGSLPGHEIHQLKHIHDGKYGNNWSWIADKPQGWVQFELPSVTEIDRIVWSRDREEPGRFEDRLASRYVIEVATEPDQWKVVASSQDRWPVSGGKVTLATLATATAAEAQRVALLSQERQAIAQRMTTSDALPMVYAGRLTSPEPTQRLHRGDPLQKREAVLPGGIVALGKTWQLPDSATDSERREALANWMIDPAHPLTARVLVNRLWHYHFGQGLVATPSDFGLNGARPTHVELLDWLASELIASGWNVKQIQRLIVTSATYRQSSQLNPAGLKADAQARLLWRFPPRRLEAEALRDAILAASGQLDFRMGGPGFDLFEPNTNYVKVYQSKQNFSGPEFRRMVYQSKPRMQLDDVFGTFDCPDAGQVTPKRNSSNTPLQALNLLNSSFILDQSAHLAARLQREAGTTPAAQIERAFAIVFGRVPAAEERSGAEQLVQEHGLEAFCRALYNASEFLYVY